MARVVRRCGSTACLNTVAAVPRWQALDSELAPIDDIRSTARYRNGKRSDMERPLSNNPFHLRCSIARSARGRLIEPSGRGRRWDPVI